MEPGFRRTVANPMVCVILSPQYDILVLSCSYGSKKACNASINKSRYWDKGSSEYTPNTMWVGEDSARVQSLAYAIPSGIYCDSCNINHPEPETILFEEQNL